MRLRMPVLLLVLGSLMSLVVPAGADDSSTLTVVGTSDVFDSNLVQRVIKPGFEAAYPRYRLNYVSKGTGAAIAYAEAGTASALVVHAASLENQFVAAGYSAEQYGRAVFYGDYVLLGPSDDPAGVLAHAPHDVVGAFQRVAAAGAAGRASFVSRGGTPGTTVKEHAIWALASGTTLCAVAAADGGGSAPSTTKGACPTQVHYPAWYHSTGLTQAPNVVNGDTCNYPGRGCYVFTDRGTFDYLRSTGAVSDLRVMTQHNAAAAPGGAHLLVNSFHAYAVNPRAFPADVAAQINAPGARAFLTWMTSPAAQAAVGAYLSASGEAPFRPDAAPELTAGALPAHVAPGSSVVISGQLRNPAPGTPALAGKPVTVLATAPTGTSPHVVATLTTDAAGAFRWSFVPSSTSAYSLSTPQLAQVEDASLSPAFGDLLAPATASLGTVTVGLTAVVAKGGGAPPVTSGGGSARDLAATSGSGSPHAVRYAVEALVLAVALGAVGLAGRRVMAARTP